MRKAISKEIRGIAGKAVDKYIAGNGNQGMLRII